MDTRTSPARLRIEQHPRRAARGTAAPPCWCRRAIRTCPSTCPSAGRAGSGLSGFTGSVGTLVVTLDEAALFADSRYWVQAERRARRQRHRAGQDPDRRRARSTSTGSRANVARGDDGRGRRRRARPGGGAPAAPTLARCGIDAAHRPRRPRRAPGPTGRRLPAAPVYEHARAARRRSRAPASSPQVRAAMRDAGATHHFVSTVDDIAWLLNLRGADVGYNPVFLAHLLIDPTRATLFVGAGKIDAALAAALARRRRARRALRRRRAPRSPRCRPTRVLLVDPKRVDARPARARRAAASSRRSTRARSPRAARATPRPPTCARAMVEDGAAMCEFYAWFEAALADPSAPTPITELTIDEKLSAARARRPGFVGPSFGTIAALQRQRRDAALPRDAPRRTRRSRATACC